MDTGIPKRGDALVHFSGGSDSTLCAALLAETHARVHLLSYDRLTFLGARDYTAQNYERLCQVYGADKFVRRVVRIDRLHRRICYHDYWRIAPRHGLAVTALAFSKLAMHWFSAAYALTCGVTVVADGAVPYMELYPDQNETICLVHLRRFYEELGIAYRNPVYHIADEVEQRLYDKGLTVHPFVRGTATDKQVFYLEQVILALFLKYYLTVHGRDGYERDMSALFADRIALMRRSIAAWRERPAESFLAPLLAEAA